jgi:hypothetical protein
MCLDKLYKKIDQSIDTGYKVFKLSYDYKLNFLYNSGFELQNKAFYSRYPPINQWIFAYRQSVLLDKALYYETYQSGFHFFKTKNQAIRYQNSLIIEDDLTIQKIKVKNITAYGTQNGIRCYVAEQMIILGETNVP